MNRIEARDVVAELSGAELDVLQSAIKTRCEELVTENLQGLALGSRIRFGRTVRPMYLAGVSGTVIGFDGDDKVKMKPDPGQETGRYHGTIRAPLALIELIR